MSNPFDFFSGIYCVNLDSRPDRWHDSKREFNRLGFRPKIIRFPGLVFSGGGPMSGRAGCFSSFRSIIQKAKDEGLENVLILEDDVLFVGDTLNVLKSSLDELSRKDWKMFYLGMAITDEFSSTPLSFAGDNLLRMQGGLCHHATAYHHSIYDKVLEGVPNTDRITEWLIHNESMERWLAENIQLKHEVYCTNPIIATQRPSWSDIDGKHSDFGRKLIQKFNLFVNNIK